MEVTLDGLIRDVQAFSPETLVQLEVASHRAGDLADLGDSLLNHFVDRCRRAGHTWAEIGQHLGVTRQAVQKRFVESGIALERFTDRARAALQGARTEAAALNHNYVGTEHQLLALFDTGGGISDVALRELGVERGGIEQDILKTIGRGPTPVASEQPFTPRAAKVVEEAATAAIELGHNYVGTEHLLLAMFRGQAGLGKQLLEKRGVKHDAVLAKVIALLVGFKIQK